MCMDMDECLSSLNNSSPNNTCDANAVCANTNGSFTCACDTGYIGDGTVCTASSTPRVDMVVVLPYTVETFTEELQLSFRESVASAADTTVDKVGCLHEEYGQVC